jgi:hypothetical protein
MAWIMNRCIMILGTRWRSWLRNSSKSQNFAGSIPDEVNGITLESTVEYQGYLLAGKGSRCLGLNTLPPAYADYLEVLRT